MSEQTKSSLCDELEFYWNRDILLKYANKPNRKSENKNLNKANRPLESE